MFCNHQNTLNKGDCNLGPTHKTSQPKRASFQSPRVSVLDRLGPINTYLRDYLNNKWKLRSEEPVHISSSQCGQAGCQLVTVHFVYCCLEIILTTSPLSQQSVFNQLSVQSSKRSNSQKKKATKGYHPTAASANMISKERDLLRSRRRKQGACTPSFSSPEPNYSPGLGQVLVKQKSAFQDTHSRVAIPYNYG